MSQIDEMVKSGAIGSGMLPKVEACITALKGGVNKGTLSTAASHMRCSGDLHGNRGWERRLFCSLLG